MPNDAPPCFKCGKHTEMDDHLMVWGTVIFTSHGTSGSAIYDPLSDGHWLRIHICDNCVKEGAVLGLVLEGTRAPRPDVTYKPFDPDSDEYS